MGLKRTKAINEIKICGWDNDASRVALLTVQSGIGKVASRKAFLDGQKMKLRGESRPKSTEGKK
jgi:hypothetical protein